MRPPRFQILIGVFLGLLGSGGCTTTPSLGPLREVETQARIQEILESMQPTYRERITQQSLEAVKAQVETLLSQTKTPDPRAARALHLLADLYFVLEPPDRHQQSRQLYQRILERFPDYPRGDQVLYQIAHGWAEEGRLGEVWSILSRLVRQYPKSPLAPEAWFRIGEIDFLTGNLEAASRAYQHVLQASDPRLQDRALYKLGWARFLVEDYTGAADRFILFLHRKGFQVTTGGEVLPLNLPSPDLDMVWEVAHTLVLAFDYMGGVDSIREYFQTRGDPEFEPYVYRRLGDLYLQLGRFKEAADLFEAFVASNPLHPDAPAFRARALEAYEKGHFVELAHQTRIRLIESFSEQSAWYQANSRRSKRRARELLARFRPQVQKGMRELVLFYHGKAQGTGTPQAYQQAIQWTQRFLSLFPEDPQARHLRFLLGEAWMALGQGAQAEEVFEALAFASPEESRDCDPDCQSLRQEAGYRALLALEHLLLQAPGGQPRPDDPLVDRWLRVSLRFLQTFPRDTRIPQILLERARWTLERKDYAVSRAHLLGVLHHPQSQRKEKYLAQRLLAQIFLEEEAYQQGEQALREALALLPPGNHQERSRLREALASTLYHEAQEEARKGNLETAARRYLQIHQEVPESPLAPVAVFQGARLWERVGAASRALEAYQVLVVQYSDSPYVEASLLRWAEILEPQDPVEAARIWEQLAQWASRDPRVSERALIRAGRLYRDQGQPQDALRVYTAYLDQFPEGEWSLEARYYQATLLERLGHSRDALEAYQKVVARWQRNPSPAEALPLVARAQLALAEDRMQTLRAFRIIPPFEQSLQEGQRLLQEVLKAYTATARFRIQEITTQATYRMAEALERFRDALLQSERPPDLSPEALEAYEFLLEEKAAPFEEKAIAFYEANVRRAQEEGLYDPWIHASFRRLAELLPVRYRREEQGEPWTGPLPDPSQWKDLDARSLIAIGLALRQQGAFQKAERAYRLALRQDPGNLQATFNLGILYELYLNRPREALQAYRRYLKKASPGASGSRDTISLVQLWISVLEHQIEGNAS